VIGVQLETQLRTMIHRAGFTTPTSKEQINAIRKNIPGQHQVDVMGWDDNFLLSIECTGKRKLGRKSLKTRISEISDELRDIRKWWRKERGPKATVRMVLATRQIIISERLRRRARQKGISIWDDDILDHYRKAVNSLGLWMRYEMMWSLGYKRELGTDPIKIEGAIEMRQKGDKIYVFPISPEKLLRFAFVSRRDPSYSQGYQRIIQTKKLQDIRTYVRRESGLIPNSIILNLVRTAKFKSYPGFPSSGTRIGQLLIPPIPCSAWIIDGQHRLMAFSSRPMSRLAKTFSLCVVAFRGLRHDTQARLFLTINETQKRVNPGLRADLASELYPSESRGAAALIVKDLATKSPFRGLVAIRPWERNKLKLANFSDSLLKSGIVRRDGQRISKQDRLRLARLVRRFFQLVDRNLEGDRIRDFVFGNNGVAVLLRILQRAVMCSGGRLTGKYMKDLIRPIRSFSWNRALADSVYSSEGDRLKLADRIMRQASKKCSWFSRLPRHERKRQPAD
jgi:DGQHR domain-containing protein